jgi:hypothetical protein
LGTTYLRETAAGGGTKLESNWKDALEAYRQYRKGAYDDAIREYKRTGKITEDMKPRKSNGALYDMNSDAVLKVLADKWMENVKGPKTPNFFRNLFKRGTDATIDMRAARTMHRLGYEGVEGAPEQWRIQPQSEDGVSNLDFAFSKEAFKQAADRLGLKPHQLQAILWYGEKMHYAQKGWSKGGVKEYAGAPEFAPPPTRRANTAIIFDRPVPVHRDCWATPFHERTTSCSGPALPAFLRRWGFYRGLVCLA